MAKVHMAAVPLLYLALLVSPIMISECFVKKSKVVCLDSEKQALLSFKKDVNDTEDLSLSTWVSEDDECCKWNGVVCDNVTGHVSELQLSYSGISGKISPSLLNLKHLTHLNLSYNTFDGIQIPSFLGSLVSLTHLDLTEAGFFIGIIPPQLGNLSNLHYLSIGSGYNILYSNNLDWLTGLSSLEYLEMRFVNLSEVSSDFWSQINKFSSLLELRLLSCELNDIHLPSSQVLKNLTPIQLLDLSSNNFEGPSICSVLNTMTHLQSLDLSSNYNLGSTFLSCLNYSFVDLQQLILRNTNLQGVIPSVISNMTSLISLDLSYNSLQGKVPSLISLDSLGSFSNLKYLDISSNLWQGVVTEVHLANFTNLKSFEASNNSLTLSVTPDWIPPFNLDILKLRDWKLDPQFPMWLKTQKNISYVDLSNTGISDAIPNWFHNFSSQLDHVNLSHNHLYGVVPIWFWNFTSQLETLVLSHNNLQGVVPYVHAKFLVDLSFNKFTGPLPHISYGIIGLDLSRNSFSGGLHGLLCKDEAYERILIMLRLGENLLTGNIPNCWEHWTQLVALDLRYNYLVGEIPTSMGLLSCLRSLSLGNNNLTGEIPASLKNCSMLVSLNLGHNKLVGIVPRWIGSLRNLRILILRSNRLNGNIPIEFCSLHLTQLAALDLRSNYLVGEIPASMGLLSGLRSLSLGNNNLTGEIPTSLKNCSMLVSLNLGHNNLVGIVPRWIGSLHYLKILILRSNRLNGDIPTELCSLPLLQILDISDNNLYGVVPRCFLKDTFAVNPIMESSLIYIRFNHVIIVEIVELVTKGKENEYESILGLVTTIDLSSNHLSGEIPEELTILQGLRFLNLSRNHLRGSIPNEIGNMKSLEALDLSWNKLSGDIPPSMSSLTFLNFLNMSRNNLSGEIPKSTQLQSLNSSSFEGNQLLCGDPLPKRCRSEDNKTSTLANKEDDDNEDEYGEEYWFRLGVGVGFGVGFFGITAPLVLCRFWRRAYFWFFQEYIWYKILDCIIQIKYITGIRKPLA